MPYICIGSDLKYVFYQTELGSKSEESKKYMLGAAGNKAPFKILANVY